MSAIERRNLEHARLNHCLRRAKRAGSSQDELEKLMVLLETDDILFSYGPWREMTAINPTAKVRR